MFLFRRSSKKKTADYSMLQADMHSHLLFGIDDGSPDIGSSLELIRGLADLGYKKLVTTPHILWDLYKNTPEIIRGRLEIVRSAIKAANIDITLDAAAEYFLDEHFTGLVERKERLLTFGNNLVLVEFSMVSQPFEFKKIIFDLQIQGYQPVLAHPERYSYLEYNKGFYDELKDAGLLFQANHLSLRGYYGPSPLNLARYLAKKQYYDLIGTDLHHAGHLNTLRTRGDFSLFQSILDTGRIINSQL
ncbi:MAG TPA: CpsB/CapC family capsule biosynthesis tyrosine phosphatase [Chitinophagaceae bacterium]|jgi:tyrosine-protein phosphatase YwqE